jgi:hypothetical protein
LSQKPLIDSRVLLVLLAIDRDLAASARDLGCGCGGVLHAANFPRKPRGGPRTCDPDFESRFSFCCAVEGCRRRATPPSVRFLGRRVYLATVVILISALRQGESPRRMAVIRREFGVDARTVQRWQTYWRDEFPSSEVWRLLRIRWVGLSGPMPGDLLARVGAPDPVVVVLRELAECASLASRAGHAA